MLDARTDHHVVHARGDQARRERHRLLAGSALPVDGGCGCRDRQPGLKPGVARDVVGLLADLRDGAGDDVLDQLGLDASPLDDRLIRGAEQGVGVHIPEPALRAVTAADRRARRLDDDDLSSPQAG
jgi:hypothetical protein